MFVVWPPHPWRRVAPPLFRFSGRLPALARVVSLATAHSLCPPVWYTKLQALPRAAPASRLTAARTRLVQAAQPLAAMVVVGQLAASYQAFQVQLSQRLASQHPEVSEQLCLELLQRLLASPDTAAQRTVRPVSVLSEPVCSPSLRVLRACVRSEPACCLLRGQRPA